MTVRRAAEPDSTSDAEFCGMVGRSPLMQELFALIRRLAPHIRTALITGEAGTEKELVARALHMSGARRHLRFVPVSCSALPESQMERELFRHAAGTLFLDEVTLLSFTTQARLLRTLESGEVPRAGSIGRRRVDVHIIAATDRDLGAEVEAGRFRADLFYRLNVVEIGVPPLRYRREDIPALAAALIRDAAGCLNKRLVGLTPSAGRWLVEAPWPGNVRELRNTLERACMLAEGEFVTERDLTTAAGDGTPAPNAVPASSAADDRSLSTMERERIREVLEHTGGNKMSAARILGLSRRALYRRIERYSLDVPGKTRS